MKKNIVDSSGWLEYFADGHHADFFAPVIEKTLLLIIPVVSLYEVFKHVLLYQSEKQAFECIECMLQSKVIDLNIEISLTAAKLSTQHKIPMADSIILATAHIFDAILWTQDADFSGLPNVKYIKK